MSDTVSKRKARTAVAVATLLFAAGWFSLAASSLAPKPLGPKTHHQVIVPGEDRFTPFSLTIRVGDSVQWINNDTDDHTVVSNDFFNTTGDKNVDVVIPGTDGNGGVPGTFTLKFTKPGVFNYYCRIHSMLDDQHQPIAPGPGGGIQDPATGNFGTPMMGVITVQSGEGERHGEGEQHGNGDHHGD
jgi:plastocyanin